MQTQVTEAPGSAPREQPHAGVEWRSICGRTERVEDSSFQWIRFIGVTSAVNMRHELVEHSSCYGVAFVFFAWLQRHYSGAPARSLGIERLKSSRTGDSRTLRASGVEASRRARMDWVMVSKADSGERSPAGFRMMLILVT